MTPLHVAISQNHMEVVDLLIQSGAQVSNDIIREYARYEDLRTQPAGGDAGLRDESATAKVRRF